MIRDGPEAPTLRHPNCNGADNEIRKALTTFVVVGLTLALLLTAAPIVFAATSTARAQSSQTVAVSLREFSITMPVKLRPGPTIFVIHNRGRFPHNFTALYGPVRFRSGTVLPGATVRLEARLRPGAYLVACTILDGGHLAQGMLALFAIGTRAHGSAHWHYP